MELTYRPLDGIQRKGMDGGALKLAKRSLVVLGERYKIQLSEFPRPDTDMLNTYLPIYEDLVKCYPWHPFYKMAFAAAVFSSNCFIKDVLNFRSALSCFAYVIANRNLVVKSIDVDVSRALQFMPVEDVPCAINAPRIEDGGETVRFIADSDIRVVRYEEKTGSDVYFEVDGMTYAVGLPLSLATHLATFKSSEEVALEVCRIQMLGPAHRRAEDAKDALINAWEIVQRSM